jgi:hypothetical protein
LPSLSDQVISLASKSGSAWTGTSSARRRAALMRAISARWLKVLPM